MNIQELGTSIFKRFDVNTYPIATLNRFPKTTIMFSKELFSKSAVDGDSSGDASLIESAQGLDDSIYHKATDTMVDFVNELYGSSDSSTASTDPLDTGSLTIDAVTAYTMTMSSKQNQRTVEDQSVYTDGMLVNPERIAMSGTIDVLNANKDTLLYELHRRKVPIQIFTSVVNPEKIITEILYQPNEKMYAITSLTLTDTTSYNSLVFSLALSEIKTFSATINSEETIVYKDTTSAIKEDPIKETTDKTTGTKTKKEPEVKQDTTTKINDTPDVVPIVTPATNKIGEKQTEIKLIEK